MTRTTTAALTRALKSAETREAVRTALLMERDALVNDHYADRPDSTCDGCRRLSRLVTVAELLA